MAIRSTKRSTEINWASRILAHIVGLLDAILFVQLVFASIASASAQDAGKGCAQQSTQSTGALKPAAGVCRINQQYLCLITMWPAYHWPGRRSYPKWQQFASTQELRGSQMESAYAVWIGQPVILQLAAADLRVPLRGMILEEAGDFIRFRVEQAWDIDIYKSMILAVEQDRWARILVN